MKFVIPEKKEKRLMADYTLFKLLNRVLHSFSPVKGYFSRIQCVHFFKDAYFCGPFAVNFLF